MPAQQTVPAVLLNSCFWTQADFIEEITHSCELLLATARRHACPYWLPGGRHHWGEPTAALHAWMREEYFPKVRAALGRPVCVALLVPPAVWAGPGAKGYACQPAAAAPPPAWPGSPTKPPSALGSTGNALARRSPRPSCSNRLAGRNLPWLLQNP